jgi:hypothetical protein
MMARSRDMLHNWQFSGSAGDYTNFSPGFRALQVIKIVACHDAGFATAASIEIDFKGVLFTCVR